MKGLLRKLAALVVAAIFLLAVPVATRGDMRGEAVRWQEPFAFNGIPREYFATFNNPGDPSVAGLSRYYDPFETDLQEQFANTGLFEEHQVEAIGRMWEGVTWITLPAPLTIHVVTHIFGWEIHPQTHEQADGIIYDEHNYYVTWTDSDGVEYTEEYGIGYPTTITLTVPGIYVFIARCATSHEFIFEVTDGETAPQAQPTPTPAPTPTPPPPTNEITVTIDGTPVNFAGQPPATVSGRTLVPARGVFEALGFAASWSPATQQATLTRGNDTIVLTIGSATFTHNGVNRTLDVPAQIIGGRTMLPLRAVLESVGGYGMRWDAATRTVVITTN